MNTASARQCVGVGLHAVSRISDVRARSAGPGFVCRVVNNCGVAGFF